MKYYLAKTEPEEYSIDMLEKEGKTVWNGVKNPLAQKFIKETKIGDLVFIYHTGKEKAIVGLGKIVSNPYKDENNLYIVDVAFYKNFSKKVEFSLIKTLPEFKDFYLVKIPRLSFMEVPEKLAKKFFELASLDI